MVFSTKVSGQDSEVVVLKHLNPTDEPSFYKKRIRGGMEQNSIPFITQDTIGQMWFATKNGVVRYDGSKYFHYKHNPNNIHSIGGNFVERIFVDNSGDVWVGTEPAVLSKYNPTTDDFTTIKGISGGRIKGISQDKKGIYWITTNNALFRYNDHTQELKSYRYKNIGLDRLLITKKGEIFVTTNETFILEFHPNNKTFTEIPLLSKDEKKRTRSTRSYSSFLLTEDHDGLVWISTYNGYLLRFNPTTKQLKKFVFETKWERENTLTVMFVFEDKQHNLWVGTWFEGLYKVLPNRKEVVKIMPNKKNISSLSNNIVHSGFQDKAGFLWFGHEFSGIDILKNENKFTVMSGAKNGLPNVEYLAITKDNKGTIWVGTAGEGLYFATKEQPNTFIKSKNIIDDIKYNWVHSLLFDSKGFLWIGTNNGLYRYNPLNKKVKVYRFDKDNFNSIPSNEVTELFEAHNHIIWIGTPSGLAKFSPENEKFYRFVHDQDNPKSLSNNHIRSICEDPSNNIWVGTFNGLNKWNRQTGNFTIFKQDYNDPNSIPQNRINSLCSKDSILWIGTYEGGLTGYNLISKEFKTFTISDGLPDNNVKSILSSDDNNLWIATTHSISKFNLTTKQFTNYNGSDGLKSRMYVKNTGWQDLEFFSNMNHKDKDGTLYFGGISGITIFNPDKLIINTFKPQTIISSLLVNGNEVGLDNLKLNPNQNHIEIDLSVLNFIQPEKNKIAYYLKGVDSVWNYNNSNHHIEYFDLNPGKYQFYYKGANNDGVWNEKENVISFTILPHFYQSALFYSLLILLFLLLFIGFIYYGIYLKRKFNKIKERKKYSQSTLKKEEIDLINNKLLEYMETQKPYLNADLSLQKLAELIETKPHSLSQVINQVHQCSFHTFINKYRIEKSKELLLHTDLKIEAIAYDAGFSSISTFNTAFKKEMKTTPSKYRKQQK